jgi:hypothetical protein
MSRCVIAVKYRKWTKARPAIPKTRKNPSSPPDSRRLWGRRRATAANRMSPAPVARSWASRRGERPPESTTTLATVAFTDQRQMEATTSVYPSVGRRPAARSAKTSLANGESATGR